MAQDLKALIADTMADLDFLKREAAFEAAPLQDVSQMPHGVAGTKTLRSTGQSIRTTAAATSQWARSTTPRGGSVTRQMSAEKQRSDSTGLDLLPERSDSVVRQRAPAFTMGSSRKDFQNQASLNGVTINPSTVEVGSARPLSYDGNVNATSSRKRTIGGSFSSTPRFVDRSDANGTDIKGAASKEQGDSPVETATRENADMNSVGRTQSTASGPDSKRSMTARAMAATAGKAYSFGKAERSPAHISAAPGIASTHPETDEAQTPTSDLLLDLDKADRYRRPHTQGPRMISVPLSTKPREDSSNAASSGPGFLENEIALNDYLSHRERTPSVVMRPESATKRRKVPQAKPTGSTAMDSDEILGDDEFGLAEIFGRTAADSDPIQETVDATPGPGYYNPKLSNTPGGRIYFQTKARKKGSDEDPAHCSCAVLMDFDDDEFGLSDVINRDKSKTPKEGGDALPGPGAYRVDAADSVVRTSTPGFSFRADDKLVSKQLERKRYFEEKARDAREGYLTTASTALVQERSKGGLILPDKKAGVDWKNRQAVQRMMHEREKVAQIGYYDADRRFIEKRAPVAVTMSQEITSRRKTEEKITSKPGVAHVKVVREREKVANNQFLGPQLQVPWGVPAEEAREGKRRKTEGGEGGQSEEEDGDMDEVYDMLNMRRDKDGNNVHYADFSEAYLRSSLAGVDRGTGLVSMARSKDATRDIGAKKLTKEERERDYLPTQVHKEWARPDGGDGSVHGGSNLLQLDKQPGRETKKVLKKGVVDVVGFHTAVRNYDDHGPGEYGPEEVLEFGKGIKGGVVPFKDIVSRSEAVGPSGQPSEAAQERYRKLQYELGTGELDLAAQAAKDGNRKEPPRAYTLYTQDRFPVEPVDEEDVALYHIGGSYFEGMHEEVVGRPALVKYDTMVGRTDKELRGRKKGAPAKDDFEDLAPVTGDELNLSVQDWKPHMEKTHAVKWVDAVDLPRFQKTNRGAKDEDAPDTSSPNYDQVHHREAFMVDMGRQRGHFDEDMDAAGGDENMPGDMAADVARSMDNALERGRYMKSTSKRVPVADLGKPTADRGLLINGKGDGNEEEVLLDVIAAAENTRLRQGLGVPSFSKQQDRGLRPVKRDEGKDVDELVVSPHPEKKSSWKRVPGVPAWSAKADALGTVGRHSDEELQLDPDAEKYMVGSGVEKGGTAMSKQIGRDGKQNKKPSREAKKIIGTEDSEQLDLDVKRTANKLHASVDWSKNDIPRRLYSSQDPDMMPNLILDADAAKNNQQVKQSYARISNQPSRSEAVYDDRENETELILSPKQDLTRVSMKLQMSWKKQLDVQMPKLTESQELDLSPRLDIVQENRRKDLPWRKASPTKLTEYDKRHSEELLLSPSDNANRTQGMRQTSWGKQTEHLLDKAEEDEELRLSPRDEINRRMGGKNAPAWEKQADGISKNSYRWEERDDEVILSPSDAASRRNVSKGSMNWIRQADSRPPDYTRYDDGDEELKLSPKLDNNKYNAGKGAAGWEKQQSRDVGADGYFRGKKEDEELMLSPKDAPRVGAQQNVSWARQADAVDANRLKNIHDSEELQLSPKKPDMENKNKNILSWARQGEDAVRGAAGKVNMGADDELLILSPNDSSRPVAAGKNAPAWNKQADNVRVERHLKDMDDEELLLSPKQAERVPAGKGAGLWTKLSGPGAGVDAQELQRKYFDEDEALLLSPKHAVSHSDRGMFSKKDRLVENALRSDEEELILSDTKPKQPKGGGFSRHETHTSDMDAKYADDEELLLSPKQAERVAVGGAAGWTKGADGAVDMNRYDGDQEELLLSPKPAAEKTTKKGEFRKGERDAAGRRSMGDDEELKLSPKDIPAFQSRGKFGQSDRADGGLAPIFVDEEELQLDPKQAPRLNTAAGAGLFGKATGGIAVDPTFDPEDEELKLSPREANPFPKKGTTQYRDHQDVKGKLFEEEELKISPKPQAKNLGGKMAPPRKNISEDNPKSLKSNGVKVGFGIKTPSVASSVVSTCSSKKRTPSATQERPTSGGSSAAVIKKDDTAGVTAKPKQKTAASNESSAANKKLPPSTNSDGRAKSAQPTRPASNITGVKSKPPIGNKSVQGRNIAPVAASSPLMSPPHLTAPSPQPLPPAAAIDRGGGGGASRRYDNVTASAADEEISKLMRDLNM